jgi:hypothetical protein
MLAVAGSLVCGTKMASIKNMRDGQSLALRWPPLHGSTQQPPKVGGREGGEVGEIACWAITKRWDIISSFGGLN